MYHVENWEKTKALMASWWRHEAAMPVVQVVSPKAGCNSACVFDWWALMRPDAKPERVLEDYLHFCENTWFGGVSFPNMFFNMGPGVLAAYSSGYLSYEPVSCTTWFENPQPWDVVEKYRFQKNQWWQFTVDGMKLFAEAGKDTYVMGMTDLGGPMDVLSSFRGAQELAMDLLMEPERVHSARKQILEDWHLAYDQLSAIITQYQEGTSAWMGIWCPDKWYPLQCDFSAMISSQQFEKFVLPDVVEQSRRLDRTIYHLDGPGQIPHLDMLLEVEELDGIQWVPGTGNPQCEALQWRPLYEKILARNKLLVLQCFDDISKLPAVLEGLPRKGLFITTGAATEEEGCTLLQNLSTI